MFEFLTMVDNYEERKVSCFQQGKLIVDTCAVNDSPLPFETAVSHPEYNQGKWVIVQSYKNRAEASAGHPKWITLMTSEPLPEYLVDRGASGVSTFLDAVSSDNEWRVYHRTPAEPLCSGSSLSKSLKMLM